MAEGDDTLDQQTRLVGDGEVVVDPPLVSLDHFGLLEAAAYEQHGQPRVRFFIARIARITRATSPAQPPQSTTIREADVNTPSRAGQRGRTTRLTWRT